MPFFVFDCSNSKNFYVGKKLKERKQRFMEEYMEFFNGGIDSLIKQVKFVMLSYVCLFDHVTFLNF